MELEEAPSPDFDSIMADCTQDFSDDISIQAFENMSNPQSTYCQNSE